MANGSPREPQSHPSEARHSAQIYQTAWRLCNRRSQLCAQSPVVPRLVQAMEDEDDLWKKGIQIPIGSLNDSAKSDGSKGLWNAFHYRSLTANTIETEVGRARWLPVSKVSDSLREHD